MNHQYSERGARPLKVAYLLIHDFIESVNVISKKMNKKH